VSIISKDIERRVSSFSFKIRIAILNIAFHPFYHNELLKDIVGYDYNNEIVPHSLEEFTVLI
jgi:hypothetical protein